MSKECPQKKIAFPPAFHHLNFPFPYYLPHLIFFPVDMMGKGCFIHPWALDLRERGCVPFLSRGRSEKGFEYTRSIREGELLSNTYLVDSTVSTIVYVLRKILVLRIRITLIESTNPFCEKTDPDPVLNQN